ncbi:MAG: mechanosensitive ion channel family protein [Spirochaeta sp.]
MERIASILDTVIRSEVLRSIAITLSAVIISRIIYLVIFALLKHTARLRHRETMSFFVERIRVPSRRFIMSAGLWWIIPALGLSESIVGNLRHLITLFIIFWVANIAVTCIRAATYLLLRKFDINARDNLQARKVNTQVKVFEQIAIAAAIIIAISSGLMTFDGVQQIGTSILASAGIAGLVIGVAAQKSLANVIAGIMIAITQPIRLDDAVIIENEWGRIEEITLTYVVVRIWDKRRLIVPINYFVDKPFQNWTRTNSDLLGSIILHLDYRTPVEVLRKKQTEILQSTDLWDKQVDVIQVIDTTPTTMIVRCLVSGIDSPTTWDLRVLVREQLISFLQKEYPECLPHTRIDAVVSEYPGPLPEAAPGSH